MDTPALCLVWIEDGRLRALRPVDALPLRIGSGEDCALQLPPEDAAAVHAELREGRRGQLQYVLAEGGRSLPATAGAHFKVGRQVLALAPAPGGGAGSDDLLAELGTLLPRLFEAADQGEAAGLLLDALRQGFGAQWGAFLVAEGDGEGFRVLRTVGERPGRDDDAVSRSVLARLAASDEPVLAADLDDDADLGGVASIHRQVSSVIAARVAWRGAPRGAVYLERRTSRREFSPGERRQLATACELAGGLLARADEAARLGAENRRLGALQRLRADEGGARLVGDGPAMRAVREQLEQVAASDVTALIRGESGTGKELAARAIHRLSPRAGASFVPVHCMALAPELVESELFGHAEGAFSGATQDRMGRFELAHGGTLFLDELGELSMAVQVKLLRVLEERVVTRVGEATERPVDVQLVAATNADLEALVAAGRFREDLYYRVAVYKVDLPPLRERLEDLPALVEHFLGEFTRRLRKPLEGLTEGAWEALRAHSWPGNLRELRNVLEQAVVREAGPRVTPGSLGLGGARGGAGAGAPSGAARAPALPEKLDEARAVWERRFIEDALAAEDGNVAATCRRLGVSSSALYRRFQQYGIDPASIRGGADDEG